MDIFSQRTYIYLYVLSASIFSFANCQTCGQTPCKDGYCCSKENGQPKNCCCKSISGGFSKSCVSATSTTSFPWWGAVLIVAGLIGVIAAIVFAIIRRRRRAVYGNI